MADASSSSTSNNDDSNTHETIPSPAPVQDNQQTSQQSVLYHVNISWSDAVSSADRDDALSCLVILLTFWFFASMTLILGVYGPSEIILGPNTSRLIPANSLLVQDIKASTYSPKNLTVKEEGESQNKLTVYAFLKPPPLNVPVNWSENNSISIPASFHKNWVYYLNKGSEVNISYVANYEGSYPLNLIIAEGQEEFLRWIGNPSEPSNTLSWNLIYGNGTISQKIEKASDYYIAVVNLNNLQAEVQLEFKISSILYDTTGAYYTCSPKNAQCSLKVFMMKPAFALLSTGPMKDSDAFYVKLSYGPRWIIYFIGSAIMTILLLIIYKIINHLLRIHQVGSEPPANANGDQRAPLLANNKDDDSSSLGSSYESVSHDEEEDVEEWFKTEAAKSLEEGGSRNYLCAVCRDAPRDCFFLPCGHSATCYACGERISDEAGTCPICRRRMKKVRRIFAV